MRESFVFYRSFYEAIKNLDGKIQGEIYTAIMEYSLYGKEIELGPVAKAMFTLIKPQIDTNNKKYESGKKGGRPSRENKPNGNQQETKAKPSDNQEETNIEPNVNDNVNDKDINSNSDELLCPSSQTDIEKIDWNQLIDFVNSKIGGIYGTIRRPLSNVRKKMIRARISAYSKEAFCEVINKAVHSDYLMGTNFCTFDWMIKPTNFEKILSGNYDNKNSRNNSENGPDEEFLRSITQGVARAEYNKSH